MRQKSFLAIFTWDTFFFKDNFENLKSIMQSKKIRIKKCAKKINILIFQDNLLKFCNCNLNIDLDLF